MSGKYCEKFVSKPRIVLCLFEQCVGHLKTLVFNFFEIVKLTSIKRCSSNLTSKIKINIYYLTFLRILLINGH